MKLDSFHLVELHLILKIRESDSVNLVRLIYELDYQIRIMDYANLVPVIHKL